MLRKTKITVVGAGYVGMSLSVLLAQDNDVTVLDVDKKRVNKINSKQSSVKDADIESFLTEKSLSLAATMDKRTAYEDASFIVVATPTNLEAKTNQFDTSTVDSVVRDALSLNKDGLILIKSTIPVGHTKFLQEKFESDRIVFSPEFLREGHALYDNLYPSRIIVGSNCKGSLEFVDLLKRASKKKDVKTHFIGSDEAEAVKLFANTYLAMRVSFFNELDSYAIAYNLDAKSIIKGVCLDKRIGDGYNNPSFGYGGYCLPKDTKQLLANYGKVPQKLIGAIVSSNSTRKDFISEEILKENPKIVGFYRLIMKRGSDNFRSSAIQGIIERIKAKGVKVLLYEPAFKEFDFFGTEVIKDIKKFKSMSEIIVTNRNSVELNDVWNKVFTRDIFNKN